MNLPVLFTAGRYDEATPQTVEYYQSLISGARLEIFEESAHMTMLDQPVEYVDIVRKFLRDVEDSSS